MGDNNGERSAKVRVQWERSSCVLVEVGKRFAEFTTRYVLEIAHILSLAPYFHCRESAILFDPQERRSEFGLIGRDVIKRCSYANESEKSIVSLLP